MLLIKTFPKYYFKGKNKLLERTTQPQSLDEEVTTHRDNPSKEKTKEILPLALRKEMQACVKPVSYSIVKIMNYGKISPKYKKFPYYS